MPYVRCGRCGLKTFSAAYWSSVDYCDTCATRLPRARRRVVAIAGLRRFGALPGASGPDAGRLRRADD